MPKTRKDLSATPERVKARDYMDAKRRSDRDIPAIPPPADPARRRSCEGDLPLFVETYCSAPSSMLFAGPLYPDQRERLEALQGAILAGGSKAVAAFRGGGKTSEMRAAIIWAGLYGHKIYGVIIGATGADATNNLDAVKAELEINELMFADFPDVCVCVRAVEGSGRRCQSQTVGGERTRIEWGGKKVIFPSLPEEYHCEWWVKAQGFIVEVRSMDGAVRGLNTYNKRPDLILLDDVETRKTVRSDEATNQIRTKIDTDIGGLAGQTKSLTVFYIGTIMDDRSTASEFTDPKRRPTFDGKRYPYLHKLPDEGAMWEQYMKVRGDMVLGGPDAARTYYKENRAQMDEGAIAAWPGGFDPKKYDSAVEKYYAEWADKQENGLEYVACELQNDPSLLDTGEIEQLTRDYILERTNSYKRARIVSECAVLSGFIDVHHAVADGHLWWGVVGLTQDFTPFVVDYGRYPKKKTVGEAYQGSIEEKVLCALRELEAKLMSARWIRDDGVEMVPGFGVDSGSGQHQQTVFQFCRGAKRRNFFPTKGENVKDRDYNTIGKNAKRRGDHWRESVAPSGDLKIPVYMFDTNYWKTFLYNRIMAESGTIGAISLFGSKPETHAELSRHWVAERRLVVQVKNAGHEYDQWDLIPGRLNHLWDVFVGALMIGGTMGCALPGHKLINRRKRRRKRKATI